MADIKLLPQEHDTLKNILRKLGVDNASEFWGNLSIEFKEGKAIMLVTNTRTRNVN